MSKRMNIPFSPPDITDEEIAQVVSALNSGWITTGPKTKEFERKIAEVCQTNKVVCLNSATAAMELTLHALGIGPGDEVLVPAYTYTASCSVIIHVGATPIMIDSTKNGLEMDYDDMASKITTKTKAIIPVDIAGILCDYDKIYEILEDKKDLYTPTTSLQKAFDHVVVIADCAHGFGAMKDGKPAGQHADFTCFSFHAVKNLTTAEGGAVTWLSKDGIDDEVLYHEFQLLSLHGQSKDALSKTKIGAWEYDIVYPAYKCNMTDVCAGIGLAQLARYDDMVAWRQEIIARYNEGFKDLPVSVLNHKDEKHTSSGHLYFVRVNGVNEEKRNGIITKMAELGVATNVHYKPLPMFTAYKKLGFDIKDYPNAFALYQNEITLPLYSRLTSEQVDYIIECFRKVIKEMI